MTDEHDHDHDHDHDNNNDTPPAAPRLEGDREFIARGAIGAGLRHAAVARQFAIRTLGEDGGWEEVTASDALAVMRSKTDLAKEGDMGPAVAMLMAQAMTLDTVFTALVMRANQNMGEYPQAFERYMRLALKAQSNSRVTLEALAKISRGGEQIVRHIHVDNRGGQAVIAETVSTGGANLLPGGPNAISTERPHAALSEPTDLRRQDALGNGLPELADAERAMSTSWREVPGTAAWQPERAEARSEVCGDDCAGEGAE